MKLNLALVISLIIAMPIQAGYMVKIPLENYQGGTLPDGSIKIGNGTPENNTEPEVDPASCKYDENNYYVEVLDSNNVITEIYKYYNGYELLNLPASKGKFMEPYPGERYYEICYTVPETEQWVSSDPIYEWTVDEDYCPEPLSPVTDIANIPLTNPSIVQASKEYGEDVTTMSYYKYFSIPIKCNTKERNVTELEQNTVTLETRTKNEYIEIISVPEYETTNTVEGYCRYQRLKDASNYYMHKWVVNGSNATYYDTGASYPLPSSSTLIDSSRRYTGDGYLGRGVLMETIGSEENYALCTWGGV